MKKGAVGRPPSLHDVRATILNEAARLFSQLGFEQASLQKIAVAVGISKPALYHYFQSKQEMYDAIVTDLLEGLYAHVADAVARAQGGVQEGAKDGAEPVHAFMRAHAAYFDSHYDGFVTLLHGFGGLRAQARSARQIAIRDRYEALLRTTLDASIAAGHIRTDDVGLAARAILSMLNWLSRWYRPGGGKAAPDIADFYYCLVLSGLAPRLPDCG